jgi:hypothetical protein
LIIDYWLLIIDYWLLIIDYWLLIIDYVKNKQKSGLIRPPSVCAQARIIASFFFFKIIWLSFFYMNLK